MRRRLRVGVVSALLTALAVVACNQILGTNDLEVEADPPDAAAANDAPATIADPGDVAAPVDTGGPSPADAGVDADTSTGPDAARFPDAAMVWSPDAGGNGHAYLVVLTNLIDWADANAAAQAAGGHLATIANATENSFVNALAIDAGAWSNDFGPWLGALQPPGSVEPAGGWTWVTGEPFSYTSWGKGQPDNSDNDESYLGYYGSPEDATWNDYPSDGSNAVYAYIVEYE